jgi:hypothetical protein
MYRGALEWFCRSVTYFLLITPILFIEPITFVGISAPAVFFWQMNNKLIAQSCVAVVYFSAELGICLLRTIPSAFL